MIDWLSQLQVTDCWRVHHPMSRVFTCLLPRLNRLDYIFISEDMHCELYGSSKYFTPQHGGDHLAHELLLAPPKQMQGRGYWRISRYLLDYSQIGNGIKREVDGLVPVIENSVNPGIVWQTWKKRMKALLLRACQRIREEKDQVVNEYKLRLEQAAERVRNQVDGDSDQVQSEFALACDNLQQVLELHSNYNQDTSFDLQVQQSERSTSYFFRPPTAHLRRTPNESVQLRDGSESSDANVISLEFRRHWGEIMGAQDTESASSHQESSESPLDEANYSTVLTASCPATNEIHWIRVWRKPI